MNDNILGQCLYQNNIHDTIIKKKSLTAIIKNINEFIANKIMEDYSNSRVTATNLIFGPTAMCWNKINCSNSMTAAHS